jgi:predicted tellurium resistance membrane protein TerC
VQWISLVGGIYLLYLPLKHLAHRPDELREDGSPAAAATAGFLGLSLFWSTVVKVEFTDLVFAVDSILVAVAMSPKLWVVLTGGILGIIAMRMVIGRLLVIVRKYPAIVDGAFIIILWVAIKLLLEWAHSYGWIAFEIPRWLSLSLIVVIFTVSFLYARRHGVEHGHFDDAAAELITKDDR